MDCISEKVYRQQSLVFCLEVFICLISGFFEFFQPIRMSSMGHALSYSRCPVKVEGQSQNPCQSSMMLKSICCLAAHLKMRSERSSGQITDFHESCVSDLKF